MPVIVTGASSNHFKSAKQFLHSCPGLYAKVIFYDLGLTDTEVEDLKQEFPLVEYRKLDFSKLPSFARLSAPCAGAYAWKPYIIHEVYCETKDDVMLWCDAGNVLTDWHSLYQTIRQQGIYSPQSSYNVERMTHIDCRQALKLPQKFWTLPMRNAAVVGFVCGDEVIKSFVTSWKDYCLEKEIVIPKRSSRADHRWDQSVLTCLMYLWDVRCTYEMVGVKVHQDCD